MILPDSEAFSDLYAYTCPPSFLLPLLAEFLSPRVFSTYNVDCGSPFLCLPEGGTTIQVCGFTLVGRLVQLSAVVLGAHTGNCHRVGEVWVGTWCVGVAHGLAGGIWG